MNGPIVVGYDGSDESRDALALATALAAPLQARLLLTWIEPVGPLDLPYEVVFGSIQDRAEDALEEVARGLRARGLEVSTRVGLIGSAAQGINELAEDASAALIVVGSSHRGRIGRVLAGTVGTRLLHGASCPVAIAPRGLASEPVELKRGPADAGQWRPATIGVAYDGSPEAQAALDLARSLAHWSRATLKVIAVAEPASTPQESVDPETFGLASEVRARDWLQAAIEELRDEFTVVTEMVDGKPGPELLAVSDQLDLLVLGSHGYGPVRRALLGSISSYLIEHCRCPLLVTPRGSHASADTRGTAAARVP